MRPPIRALLLVCLLTAPGLLAQVGNVQFGQPFPLTNTRYGEVSTSESVLLSNDAGTFLFWLVDEGVRVTKLGTPEPQSGRLILESLRPLDLQGRVFDVVWTGSHFLVAATAYDGTKYAIAGQLLDANANVVGGRLTLVDRGTTPALAASSTSILLVYASGRERARVLSLNGTPTATDRTLSDVSPARHDVASNGDGFAVIVSGLGRRDTTLLDRDGAITAVTGTNANDTGNAVASDGADYLVITTGNSTTQAHLLRTNGTYERTTTLGGGALAAPAVTWSGDRYVIAFSAAFPRELRIAHVDREARGVIGEESRPFLVPSVPGITSRSGRVHVAYGTSPVLINELPLSTNEPQVATVAVFDQQLLAAASSSSATMIVWGEDRLRAGIRFSDGRWRERTVEGAQAGHAVAESDGNGFLVLALSAEDATKSVAIRFDANGVPLSQRTPIPFKATGAVWTGQAYAIVGVAPEGIRAMFVDPSGIAATPVDVENSIEEIPRAAIAMSGNEFLVVWELPQTGGPKIEGALLTETLERVSASDIHIALFGQWPAVAVRNNVYQIAWASGPVVYEASLHDGLLGPTTIVYSGAHDQKDVQVAVHDNMSFVLWLDTFSIADGGAVHRIKSDFVTTSFRTAIPTAPIILRMPGGETGYIGAASLPAAPHYGSTRITMALGDVAILPRAQAPVASTRMHEDRSVLVEWSSALDAEGYRVEYRIDDGPWTEIERWFDPNERSMTFGPIRSGVIYSFRVRAWSAGGTGPYSNEAHAFAGRRRAVRR